MSPNEAYSQQLKELIRLRRINGELLTALSNFFCSDCATRAGQEYYPPMRQSCPSCMEARAAIAKATGA